jgi:hypothetical protein
MPTHQVIDVAKLLVLNLLLCQSAIAVISSAQENLYFDSFKMQPCSSAQALSKTFEQKN